MKVLVVFGILSLLYILTGIRKNRNNSRYLRNKVANLEKIVDKLKVQYGKTEEGENEKG